MHRFGIRQEIGVVYPFGFTIEGYVRLCKVNKACENKQLYEQGGVIHYSPRPLIHWYLVVLCVLILEVVHACLRRGDFGYTTILFKAMYD